MTDIIRVLIVDDSAYVRKVIRQMLSRSPFIEVVGAARDGREALELVEQLKPDVVTCDLIMPELDGVGFIKAQMARRPVPGTVAHLGERLTGSQEVVGSSPTGSTVFFTLLRPR